VSEKDEMDTVIGYKQTAQIQIHNCWECRMKSKRILIQNILIY